MNETQPKGDARWRPHGERQKMGNQCPESLFQPLPGLYSTAMTQKRLCLRTLGRGNNWSEIDHEHRAGGTRLLETAVLVETWASVCTQRGCARRRSPQTQHKPLVRGGLLHSYHYKHPRASCLRAPVWELPGPGLESEFHQLPCTFPELE